MGFLEILGEFLRDFVGFFSKILGGFLKGFLKMPPSLVKRGGLTLRLPQFWTRRILPGSWGPINTHLARILLFFKRRCQIDWQHHSNNLTTSHRKFLNPNPHSTHSIQISFQLLAFSKRCFRNASEMLQRCFRDASEMLQRCFRDASEMHGQ